jgi:hypothetical protein
MGRCFVIGASGFLLAAAWALLPSLARSLLHYVPSVGAPTTTATSTVLEIIAFTFRDWVQKLATQSMAGPSLLFKVHSSVCVAMFVLERIMVQPAAMDNIADKVLSSDFSVFSLSFHCLFSALYSLWSTPLS